MYLWMKKETKQSNFIWNYGITLFNCEQTLETRLERRYKPSIIAPLEYKYKHK